MSGKRDPWIKFYFADFCGDPRLKLCSRNARSLWLDMLRIMHESDPYGFLMVESVALTPQQLANLVGDADRRVRQWLDELKLAGVPSIVGQDMPDDVRDLVPAEVPNGTILSRRMVRDAAKRERDRVNGGRGGNPTLTGTGLTGGDNPGSGERVNPRQRGWLRPRSQKPEPRYPLKSPQAAVNPPPPPADCWDPLKQKAIAAFGQTFCDYWLFPSLLVTVSADEVALEAPNAMTQSHLARESQKLHDLLGKVVKFRVAAKANP